MSRHKKPFYEVTNKSPEKKSVDILIYGSIPEFDWDTWELKNSAEKFVKDFKALEKDYDRINIHINSPGGSVYHGFPIFNVIANSKKEIHTYNDGIAASMGGVLLLAGKTVHTAKNAMLMIHNALSWTVGNAEEMRDVADMLEKYDGIIAQNFADKSGKSIEDIKAKFLNYKDHFLTADEAKEEGFVDVIEDYESEDAPPEDIVNMAFGEVLNFYRGKSTEKQEQSFFAKVTNHLKKTFNLTEKETPSAGSRQSTVDSGLPSPEGENPTNQSKLTNNESPMDFKKSLDILNKESITPEDIAAIKAEISNFTGANEKFTAEEVQAKVNDAVAPIKTNLDTVTAEKTALETQVTDLTTAKNTIEAENKNLKLDIEAYRKSGVQIANAAAGNDKPDEIEGEETTPSFYSEADAEMKRMRAEIKS